MYRTARSSRRTDNPGQLVRRRVRGSTLAGWAASVAGWLGFVGVFVRCILTAPHP